MMFEKVEITDVNTEGLGVGRASGRVLFVKGATKGDVVNATLVHENKNFVKCEVAEFVVESPFRAQPFCAHFGVCGGCTLQNLQYEEGLKLKQKQIESAFKKFAKAELSALPTVPSEPREGFRNKMDYAFSAHSWIVREGQAADRRALGLHVAGRYDRVVEIEKCHLQGGKAEAIRNFVRDYTMRHKISYFDPKTKTGNLRSLIIRTSEDFKETMVILTFFKPDSLLTRELLGEIEKKFSPTAILWGVNKEPENESLEGVKLKVFSGNDFITQTLGEHIFRVSAASFFQTNSNVALELAHRVTELAGAAKGDVVYDLYCGVGVFSVFLAATGARVVGVESSAFSLRDALFNKGRYPEALMDFVQGKVEDVIDEDFTALYGKPKVVVLDPPRAGLSPKVVEKLLELRPQKIIYVSCNPATQARDFALLSGAYKVTSLQGFDMFAHTMHVESLAVFELI